MTQTRWNHPKDQYFEFADETLLLDYLSQDDLC